ncbi:MAG: transcription termination/antitermination protein NusA [Clostridia bacterium]|nr:transcription termination/antitermination protein NusA [Clostridia bacterium]
MNSEFFEAVSALAAEKNISTDYLFTKIEAALAAAMRKNYGGSNKEREVVKCNIDPEKHTIKIWAELEVVDEITEPGAQILPEDAKKLDKKAKVGSFVNKPIELSEYGRIAAQTAKHVIRQGIREAERSRQIEEFRSKKQEIVSAKVARIDPIKGNVSLEIAGGDAVLPKKEQVPGESFYEGQHILVYIVDVRDDERGSKVMISRTHPGFVRRLFEREVPEIFEGEVEIKSVSREAGSRTKIAVYAADEDIDPVGACIGPKGARVNTIVDVLGGEKIDIIEYSEDPCEYISAALAPAQVTEVLVAANGAKECRAAVPDNQLSLAIGNKGQNARLAAKLTGWKIDIKPESVFYEEIENEKAAALEAEIAAQEAAEAEEAEAEEAVEETETAAEEVEAEEPAAEEPAAEEIEEAADEE